MLDRVGDRDGKRSYPFCAVAHKLFLNLMKHLVRLLVRWSNGDNIAPKARIIITMDQVCEEQVEALDHDLIALLLVDVIPQVIDTTRRSDPLLPITGVPESRQACLNWGAGDQELQQTSDSVEL